MQHTTQLIANVSETIAAGNMYQTLPASIGEKAGFARTLWGTAKSSRNNPFGLPHQPTNRSAPKCMRNSRAVIETRTFCRIGHMRGISTVVLLRIRLSSTGQTRAAKKPRSYS